MVPGIDIHVRLDIHPTHPTAALAVLTGTQSDIALGTLAAAGLTAPAAPRVQLCHLATETRRLRHLDEASASPWTGAPRPPGHASAQPLGWAYRPNLLPGTSARTRSCRPENAVRHVPPASAIRNATARTSAIPISHRPSLTCTSTTSPNIHIDTHLGTPIRGTPHLPARGLRSTTFPPLRNFTETGKRYPEM
ncbi:hypothetical protein C0Q63_22220 [Streptomyces albidoflavus]|nr:hypothetical protein C0Q63_22220 [Streptomyces albidoflavus]